MSGWENREKQLMSVNSGLFGLIILALDIWAIIKVMGSNASGGKKLLWILLILVLPVIGLVIWALAGPSSGQGKSQYPE
jgi:cytochrome bd-type quinol oxidase subunit 2